MAFSPSEEKPETHTRVHKKRKERKESFRVVREKRDFSDDDDEVVYIFIREEDGAAITA